MGLDQYIFRETEELELDGSKKLEEVFYWRKNYELNEWAEKNFCPDDIGDFNCEKLYLDEKMVKEILDYIIYNLDKPNTDEHGYEGLVSKDVFEAFLKCKEMLENNETICYYAWW